jgi:hypothetical protein
MYMTVSVRICLYKSVSVCMCLNMTVCLYVQAGLCPMTTRDYKDNPFSCETAKNRTVQMESFHNAFASLLCFDATKNKDNKKPYFNFSDRDNNHIVSARHSPPYNAKVFFLLWLKAAPYFGEFGKEIVQANTQVEIEALRNRTITNVHCKDGEFITGSEPFLSAELKGIVDNIHFMSVYGHKTLFVRNSCLWPKACWVPESCS